MNDPQPLKPWTGETEAEAPDTGSAAYLWIAGILCGVILAVGSRALLGHFAERPSLAAADPSLVRWIGWAQAGGWGLAGLSLGGWIWALLRDGRKA